MADLITAIKEHQNLSEEDQKKAGKAGGNDMGEEHKNFLQTIIRMLDNGEIDTHKPQSFLNRTIYDSLDELAQGKVDLSMVNLADILRQIEWFYRSKTTPNASPELQNMIEHLWQMKDRVENNFGDVFKF